MLAVISLALAVISTAEILEDPRGTLTAAEAWTSPAFVALPPRGTNLGYSSSTFWIRLRLTGEGPQIVDLTSSPDVVELYEAPDAVPQRSGTTQPPSRRAIPATSIGFRVVLARGVPHEVVLAIRSRDTLLLIPRLTPETEFWSDLVRERTYFGIYYGILLAMIAYNLFLFVGTRERAYLAYSAFQASYALTVASLDKLTFDVLWPLHPVWAARSEQVFAAVACVASLVFTRAFLTPGRRLDLALRVQAAWCGGIALIAAFTEADALKWIAAIAFLGALLTIAAGAVHTALRRRATDARVFAIAWSVMLVACWLAILSALGVVRTPDGFPLMKVGSAIEAVLLSLALASRINALRRDREAAQREVLRAKSSRLEALSMLVSGFAHEIGNPLNVAHGGAQELARLLDAGDITAARPIARLAASGVQRIKRILDNLRSYLRTGDVRDVPTDLTGEITAAIELTAARLSAIRVEQRLAVLPPIRARPGELHQVVVNLITNAAHAMPDGGALIIESAAHADTIEIAIEDTGPGVPPAQRDAIFEPFFTTRRDHGGTGLGLSVAREIVLRHGGAIRVEDGRSGARFVVALPIAATRDAD